MLVNFQSVRNKEIDLNILLLQYAPDVVFGCETWLTSQDSSSEFFPKNYTVYRTDRDSRGGGVLIAVNTRLRSWESVITSPGEICACEVENGKMRVYMVCAYRSQTDVTTLDSLESIFLNKMKGRKVQVIIAGDLNLPELKWHEEAVIFNERNNLHRNVQSIMTFAGMKQIVSQPTRNENCLDLFFTNIQNTIVDVEPGISDHATVLAKFQTTMVKNTNSSITCLDYPRANVTGRDGAAIWGIQECMSPAQCE